MLLPSGARRRSPGAGLVGGRRLCSTLAVAAAGPCIENARPSGSKGYNGRSRTRQSNPRYSAARTSISRPPRTTRSPGALPIRARAVHRRGLQPTSSPCRRGLSQPATVRAAHRPTVKSGGLIDVRPEGPTPVSRSTPFSLRASRGSARASDKDRHHRRRDVVPHFDR
jgi:hypothetical protein